MADYIEILDTQIEPLAPVTSELMNQIRDNPIAIAEGAPNAPRIETSALNLSADSSNTTTTAGGSTLMAVDTGRSANWTVLILGEIRLNTTSQPGTSSITFQGSNDNATYTTVSTILVSTNVGITFTGPRLLQSGSAYRYYKIVASGDGDHVVIPEAAILPIGAPNV